MNNVYGVVLLSFEELSVCHTLYLPANKGDGKLYVIVSPSLMCLYGSSDE